MSTTPTYGISFEELENSPRIHISTAGMTATRVFLVAWADWINFAHEVIGTYRIVGGTAVAIKPIPFPQQPNLIADEIAVEPFLPDNPDGSTAITLGSNLNAYTSGGTRITVTYRTRFDETNLPRSDLPSVPNATYLTYQADLGAEVITIPGRMFEWADGTKIPDDVNAGIVVPTGTYTLTWHRVLQPPWTVIRAMRGRVNASTFLGAPAETVLFLGASIIREFQLISDGGFWRVEYRFAENTKELASGTKVGWNHFWRENVAGGEHWATVTAHDNSEKIYKTGDFTTLFAYGTV